MQIGNILNKLNKVPAWQKLLALVVLSATELAYFHYVQWTPLDAQLVRIDSEFSDLDRRYKEQKAIAEDLATFQQNIRKLEEDLRLALTQLPREKEIPSLLRDIYILGKKSGVEFKTFQPGSESPRKLYAELPIKLQITGGYHEIAVFFDRVGKLSRIVNISDIDLMPSTKDGVVTMNVNCTATTFMFLGGAR